jgi:hypothetical protein
MNNKRSINMLIGLLLITSILILNVCAADTSGTYTDYLTDGSYPIDIYVEGEYMGEYTDYMMYQVNLDKDQNVKVKLEVPNNADFDLFVITQDEEQGWSSTLDNFGEDEELNIKVPETGEYIFIVASWEGSGTFTLKWETSGVLSDVLIYVLIGVVVAIAVIVVLIFLMRRRGRASAPPPPPYVQTSQPTPAASEPSQMSCPYCNGPLNWIDQYQRWYCYKCAKYA